MPSYAERPYRRWVAGICLAAIPVNMIFAGVVFVLFPRLAFRGAFGNLGGGRSGYTEQVNLTQPGITEESSSAVLWLQITPESDRNQWTGYLRGGTLDHFDGEKWSRSARTVAQTMYADSNGVFRILKSRHGLRQSITLVRTEGATLFGSPLIGEVIAPLATLQVMSDGSVRWSSGWRKPLHYDVVSFDASSSAAPLPNTSTYLQLASVPLDRTRALVQKIAPQRAPLAKAQAIETYLRTHYQYSLEQGGPSQNPVETFLFDRQRGPCGHFASSMAVMLRVEGIPSRMVTGYYKGHWNERLQQYLIRERDAHAWVEAYIPGKGWVSFDPTPRATAAPASRVWMPRLQENWEYLNYQWDRLVIEYDLYSQVTTFKEVQSNTNRMNTWISSWLDRHTQDSSGLRTQNSTRGTSFWNLKSGMVVLACGVLLLGGLRRRRLQAQDPTVAFYRAFLDKMARKGFPKSASETGLEYAVRLRDQLKEPVPSEEITRRYYHVRFAKTS